MSDLEEEEDEEEEEDVLRDEFSLHKMVVLVTEPGKVYREGRVLDIWSLVFIIDRFIKFCVVT